MARHSASGFNLALESAMIFTLDENWARLLVKGKGTDVLYRRARLDRPVQAR